MEQLKKLRKAKGLTQKQLASLIHCAEATISQYETGKRAPSYEALLRISEELDTSVDYLLGKTNDPAHVTMSEVDVKILKELGDLTPSERNSLLAFLAGLKANRAE